MTNHFMTFTTYLDNDQKPYAYNVEGLLSDNDNQDIYIGEFSFNFDKTFNTLMHYIHAFNFNVEAVQAKYIQD